MPLLILNAGSSSLKFTLIEPASDRVWTQGTIELAPAESAPHGDAVGIETALQRIFDDVHERLRARDVSSPSMATTTAAGGGSDGAPAQPDSPADSAGVAIDAVAHRVVHGGARFTAPVRISPDVRAALTELIPLAPLHNPPSLAVIDAAMTIFPGVPHIAVFDTAFHATLAPEAYTYPLPHEWTERWGLRRFGFHGLSHAYGARRAAEMLDRPPEGLQVIVAHLGNGASVTAIRSGASVDTTMGFTPLEGLMMGTRSGSVDPGLLLYLQRTCGVSSDELDHVLNTRSGLLGVSGVSSDMRAVLAAAAAGDARARLATGIFAHRARQAIGAMAVTLGRVDALVFTGGIGEHSPEIRAAICDGLSCVGLVLDDEANRTATPDAAVSAAGSPGKILIVAAREDITIARAAAPFLPARAADA